MTPLPMVRHNECLPKCGKCCGGAVLAFAPEVQPIIDYLKAQGKKAEKQLRFWNRDMAACPFLMPDKRCFVYEARPGVCRAFGHVKFDALPCEAQAEAKRNGVPDLACPYEEEGKVYFDPWPMERIRAFDAEHDVRNPNTEVVPLAMLGAEIVRASKRDGKMTVPYLKVGEYNDLARQARSAALCPTTQEAPR